MTNLEMKIMQLEHEAAQSEAAYRDMRRAGVGDSYDYASRRGAALANLLRDAADARQKSNELRARLPPGNPLYREPPRQPPQWRTSYAA